jgi:hypothetical protein
MKDNPYCVLGVLTFIFTVLKLVGIIHWSWWWVFSPVWIPIACAVLGFIITWLTDYLLKP